MTYLEVSGPHNFMCSVPSYLDHCAGYHIYIDAGAGLASEASLIAVISEAATWNIKVPSTLVLTIAPNPLLR